jgi:redox-sensitive bicupin YhaK (pirin superfamily)
VASQEGEQGAVSLHQDVKLYAGLFDGEESASLSIGAARQAYVHLARGSLSINATPLQAGDALQISGGTTLQFHDGAAAEVLVFDLPAEQRSH